MRGSSTCLIIVLVRKAIRAAHEFIIHCYMPFYHSVVATYKRYKARTKNKTEYHLNKHKDLYEYYIAQRVKEIIANYLGASIDIIELEMSIKKDIVYDSLDALELVMAIEEEFDIEIPDGDAEKFDTLKDVVEYIKSHKN